MHVWVDEFSQRNESNCAWKIEWRYRAFNQIAAPHLKPASFSFCPWLDCFYPFLTAFSMGWWPLWCLKVFSGNCSHSFRFGKRGGQGEWLRMWFMGPGVRQCWWADREVCWVCVGVCSFQSLLLVGHSFCGCVWKHDVSCVNCCRDHHCWDWLLWLKLVICKWTQTNRFLCSVIFSILGVLMNHGKKLFILVKLMQAILELLNVYFKAFCDHRFAIIY